MNLPVHQLLEPESAPSVSPSDRRNVTPGGVVFVEPGSTPFELDDELRVYGSDVARDDGWGRIQIYKHGPDYCLQCVGVADFYITPPDYRVSCVPCRDASIALIRTLLRGPVRAFCQELMGRICIHASTVLLSGHVVAFAGHSGSGKSTLAASLVALGHELISDDVLAVAFNGTEIAFVPDDHRIRLTQSTVGVILGSALDRSDEYADSSKCEVPVRGIAGQVTVAKNAPPVLYLLNRQQLGARNVEIQPVRDSDRFVELLRHSYCARAVDALGLGCRRFERLSQLSRTVAVRTLTYCDGLEKLGDVHAAIHHDIACL